LAGFKERSPDPIFKVAQYTDFQAAIAASMLQRIEELSVKRYDNGMRILQALGACQDYTIPRIWPDSRPAFSRLPVIVHDPARRDSIRQHLLRAGIEATAMYPAPLHHQFGLGYKQTDFPRASYAAGHLLTLPVHPFVQDRDIDTIVNILLE
jgi:dTDP-4-amino-4,6-dideoxygalactose transaminase